MWKSLRMVSFYSRHGALAATPISMIPGLKGDLENSSSAGKSTLSSDVEIEGSITFQKELLIDGKVQGQINSDGVLTIGENADIHGDIKTKSIILFGKVHGNIAAAERCELKTKSILQGDLKAARLVIEDGATFIGHSEVTSKSGPKSSDSSNRKWHWR